MKKTKKLLIVIASLALLIILCSCSQVQTVLSTPQNLVVNDGVLHWQSVDGASAYIVAIDGIEQPKTTSAQLDLSKINLEAGKTYSIQVKATGDGYLYLNSEFSTSLSYTHTAVQGGGNGDDKSEENGGSSSNQTSLGTYMPKSMKYQIVAAPSYISNSAVANYTDGEYNYYLFDLGYVKNVPISSGTAISYFGTGVLEIEFSSASVTTSSVERAIETTISETVSEQSLGSANLSIGGGFDTFFWLETGYSRSWGTVTDKQNSTTNTYATTEEYAKTITDTISYKIGENGEQSGKYRITLFADCDMYLQLKTSRDNSKEISKEIVLSARPQGESLAKEYTELDTYFDDMDIQSKIDLPQVSLSSLPIPKLDESMDNVPEDLIPVTPIEIDPNKYLCAKDKDYNMNTSGTDKSGVLEDIDIGHIVINGCIQKDNHYVIKDEERFEIQFVFDENPEDLPWKNDLKVISDTAKKVVGTDIQGEKIGKGAYQVRIKYKDGSYESKTIVARDFMNNKDVNSCVSMLNATSLPNLAKLENIASIEVTIVYEVEAYLGWNFANIGSYDVTNWRCEYVFDFQ